MNLVNELMRCAQAERDTVSRWRTSAHQVDKPDQCGLVAHSRTKIAQKSVSANRRLGATWSGLWLAKADAFTRRECGSNRRTALRPRFFAEGAAAAANR